MTVRADACAHTDGTASYCALRLWDRLCRSHNFKLAKVRAALAGPPRSISPGLGCCPNVNFFDVLSSRSKRGRVT